MNNDYLDRRKENYKLIVDPAGKLWLLSPGHPVPDQHIEIKDQVILYYGKGLLPMFWYLNVYGGNNDSEGTMGS